MTLSGASTPGQSRPGNNGNEGVLHISRTLIFLLLCRDAVDVFFSLRRLGKHQAVECTILLTDSLFNRTSDEFVVAQE